MLRRHDNLRDQEKNNAPMVEIFGGVFALLLVLFLLINTFSQLSLQERLEGLNSEGDYKVSWGVQGTGYSILAFPDELRIVESGDVLKRDEICVPGSPFASYVRKIYSMPKQQLIFIILEGSVKTMAIARECMRTTMPAVRDKLTIGWIIADRELLKSVSLDDIPPYIERVIKRQ